MIPFKLFYVTLSTPNIDRTVEWYQEKLGYKVFVRKEFPEFKTRLAILEQSETWLEFIEQEGSKPLVRQEPPKHSLIQGVTQIVFLVDDLDAKVAEMKSKGLTPVWMRRADSDLQMQFRIFRDCDGNFIQFTELMPEAKAHLEKAKDLA